MARVYPAEITASDVAAMLTALDKATPDLGVAGRAYFVLADPRTSPFPVVFVTLGAGENELSACRAAAGAIAVLPYLHAWVVRLHAQDDPHDPREAAAEHDLDSVRVDGGEVYVGYCARSYNSTWGHSFRKDPAGRWRHLGSDASVVETPRDL